jgi:malate dehydrogenase (oxaloacetate-decarboxylating)
VATGSPFPPVDYHGVQYTIGQANNALIFPGLGLGVIAAGATQVTDNMLAAAAHAVSELVDTQTPGAPLLPRVEALRETSAAVAAAVAQAADADGVARARLDGDVHASVRALMWEPVYRPVRPA